MKMMTFIFRKKSNAVMVVLAMIITIFHLNWQHILLSYYRKSHQRSQKYHSFLRILLLKLIAYRTSAKNSCFFFLSRNLSPTSGVGSGFYQQETTISRAFVFCNLFQKIDLSLGSIWYSNFLAKFTLIFEIWLWINWKHMNIEIYFFQGIRIF